MLVSCEIEMRLHFLAASSVFVASDEVASLIESFLEYHLSDISHYFDACQI